MAIWHSQLYSELGILYVLLLSASSGSSDINAMKGSSRQAGRVIGDGTTLASKRVILNHRTNNCRPDAQRKQEFRYAKWKAIISAASYHREFEDETHTSVTAPLRKRYKHLYLVACS